MKKQLSLAFLAILLWSTMATVSKFLLGEFSQIQVLGFTSLCAFLALFLYNLAAGRLKRLKGLGVKRLCAMALVGLPGTLLYYAFYYAGAARLPASQAFIINYLWPILSVVFACVLLKEKITGKKALALALSFLGVGVVAGEGLLSLQADTLAGALCCLLGAVCYGLFTALCRKFPYDKSLCLMLGYALAFAFALPALLAGGPKALPGPVGWAGFAWNGMLVSAVANTAWVTALARGNTAKISNLAYATPVLSLVWSHFILREPFSWTYPVGLTIILLGIVLQLTDKKEGPKS